MKTDRIARTAAIAMVVVSAVALWKSLQLDRWGFDGPDAGLFPQILSGICLALSLLVAIWPGRPNEGEEGDADASEEAAISTVDTFSVYAVALLALAAGTMFLGFAPTILVVTLLIIRFAEGRSWRAALSYGVICSLIGLVAFGWLLRVDLPEGPIERAFYSMVR